MGKGGWGAGGGGQESQAGRPATLKPVKPHDLGFWLSDWRQGAEERCLEGARQDRGKKVGGLVASLPQHHPQAVEWGSSLVGLSLPDLGQ